MDGKFEETFHEIIRFVDSQYRTIPEKKGRAIAGLSMGGFHTLYISSYYPDTFDYMGVFSAAIMPDEKANPKGYGNIDNATLNLIVRNLLVKSKVYENIDQKLTTQKASGYKLYWIAIGKDDFLYPANVELRKELDAMDFPYIYRESEGGHTWRNWRIYLSEFLPLLFN